MSSASALFPDVRVTQTMNLCKKGKSGINFTWVGICNLLPPQSNYVFNKSNGEIGLRKQNIWQHIWNGLRMQYVISHNFILYSTVKNFK